MKKIKIYQVDLNSGYAFIGYSHAKDKIKMEDYSKVAEFGYPYLGNEKDDEAILDDVFMKGNDGRLQQMFLMRSVSVSDIIEIDNIKYYVNSFGFEKMEE